MPGGAIFRNWPAGVVVAGTLALSLGATLGGDGVVSGPARYPVRIELTDERRSSAIAATGAEASEVPPKAGEGAAPDFTDAFAGLGKPSEPQPAAAAPAPPPTAAGQDGMLAVRFNLADPYATTNDASGQIELRKHVRVDGADVGDATIRVTDGATITIARDDLGKLLSGAGRDDLARSLPAGGAFVSFDRIRQAGLSVRYDAASDRILLAS